MNLLLLYRKYNLIFVYFIYYIYHIRYRTPMLLNPVVSRLKWIFLFQTILFFYLSLRDDSLKISVSLDITGMRGDY